MRVFGLTLVAIACLATIQSGCARSRCRRPCVPQTCCSVCEASPVADSGCPDCHGPVAQEAEIEKPASDKKEGWTVPPPPTPTLAAPAVNQTTFEAPVAGGLLQPRPLPPDRFASR